MAIAFDRTSDGLTTAPDLASIPVAEIMRRWPQTIGVFVDLDMHCIGCPIGVFHTPLEAADEHGIDRAQVLAELERAIAGGRVRAARAGGRRRSAAAGAAP